MKKYLILPIYFLILSGLSYYVIAGTWPMAHSAAADGWWMAVIPMVGVMVLAAVLPFMWTAVLWHRLQSQNLGKR